MSERRPLLVLGTTDFSAHVAASAADAGFGVAGFVENLSRERSRETLAGLPIHWIDDLAELSRTHIAVCGLGTTRRSLFVEQAARHGLHFATVVHPTAYVATGAVVIDHVSVGSGSVVGAGAVVVADVPDRVQVLGVPARIVKEGIDPR